MKVMKGYIIILSSVFILWLVLCVLLFTKEIITEEMILNETQLVREGEDYFIEYDGRYLELNDNNYSQIDLTISNNYSITYSYHIFNDKLGKVERISIR